MTTCEEHYGTTGGRHPAPHLQLAATRPKLRKTNRINYDEQKDIYKNFLLKLQQQSYK